MKEQCEISVIVPIYNAEHYLEECINSIREQTYPHLQIILINDGSSDASEAICRRHASQDNRILFCNQDNKGVIASRNRGISLATGRYISFVDADDYLDKSILDRALRCARVEKSELVCWNVTLVRNDSFRPEAAFGRLPESSEEVFSAIVSDGVCPAKLGPYFRAVWGKLFDADIIRRYQLQFPDLPYGEDAAFLLNYMPFCKTIRLLHSNGYFYRYVSTSIVHSFHMDSLQVDLFQMRLIQDAQYNWGLTSNGLAQDAVQVFGWLTFNELLENSLAGWKMGRLALKEIYVDCSAWFRCNFKLMTRKTNWISFPKYAKIHMAGPFTKCTWMHCIMAHLLILYKKIFH